MSANARIEVPQDQLTQFACRYRVRRLALFGSVLGDSFGPDSDADVLAEFEPGHVPGRIGMAAIKLELSAILRRKAGLRTAAELSRYFRSAVVQEAQTV
jgi:uncharacterized protein